MKLYQYHFTVKHDGGTIRLNIIDSRITKATRRIMNLEGCPFRAIRKIKRGVEIGTTVMA